MKFLLWVVIGIVVVMWLTRSNGRPDVRGQATRGEDAEPEPMRQCAYCGVHLPASEAIVSASGAAYCNDDHRRLHAGS